MGYPSGEAADGELDPAEALRLLAGAPIGRLIFTIGALPAVRPMSFAVADRLIILPAAPGSAVARKVDGDIVVFQADQLDAETWTGWSVTVTGRAALVTDPEAIARYRAVPPTSRVPGERDQFLTITTELTEGRRIGWSA